jgi:hypothetical protein
MRLPLAAGRIAQFKSLSIQGINHAYYNYKQGILLIQDKNKEEMQTAARNMHGSSCAQLQTGCTHQKMQAGIASFGCSTTLLTAQCCRRQSGPEALGS